MIGFGGSMHTNPPMIHSTLSDISDSALSVLVEKIIRMTSHTPQNSAKLPLTFNPFNTGTHFYLEFWDVETDFTHHCYLLGIAFT
ncbi:hypothetical protein E2C01_039950 [Portunus trituberculatus]|uniref:Uncharacterized protein n=1 Tax=Portunus trituberculatus TaxID=210409 RepID=A0A5B7FL50_PORTR|nr:hypothetical protein [Portunus trituberculatus]